MAITNELIMEKLEKLEKLIMTGSNSDKINKLQKVIKSVNEKGVTTVDEIMFSINISKPYALQLMKEVTNSNENIEFFKGSPHRPSSLITLEGDRVTFFALNLDKEMSKKASGATLSFKHIAHSFNLDNQGVQEVVSALIRTGHYSIEGSPAVPYFDRRLRKKWKN